MVSVVPEPIRKLSQEVWVRPQPDVKDLAALAALGVRSVICNRPDGEAPDQPRFAELEAEAKQHGIEMRYQPIVPGQISEEQVSAFHQALAELPGPTLAYCRTGTRAAQLWALSQAGAKTPAEIIETARKAGYDLSGLASRIAELTAARR